MSQNLTLPAFDTCSCFAAGTLVHTKEGLIPIEKLKIGDWVLSKPESGTGEKAYKRVVNTFVHHDKEVMHVPYIDPSSKERSCSLTATYDHPFWVQGQGWTAAAALEDRDSIERNGTPHLQLKDGSDVEYSWGTGDAEGPGEILMTDQPGVGWIPVIGRQSYGTLWDFEHGRLIANGIYYDDNWAGENFKNLYAKFRTKVYNIEVEGYHTYFVGAHGVWVHNANCSACVPVPTFSEMPRFRDCFSQASSAG